MRCRIGRGRGGPEEPDEGALRGPVDDRERRHAGGEDPRAPPQDRCGRGGRSGHDRRPAQGQAGPTLLIAALDGYGFMVSGITPDGYLTLDRPTAAPYARFDAFLLGQPVIISTARGAVPGVVSRRPFTC